ncbi:MAG: DUF1990 family protein [Fimbriimonadaceae bacterium]
MSQSKWSKVVAAKRTWDPVAGGRRSLVWWIDDLAVELGHDPDGSVLSAITELALTGNYYPMHVIHFDGLFRAEARHLVPGDRILQTLKIGPLSLWSGAEIFLAECSESDCNIGYVTTSVHHGRGVWQARIFREGTMLMLRVRSQSGPQSWAFWAGLPLARYLQKRARRKAIERFQKMCSEPKPTDAAKT